MNVCGYLIVSCFIFVRFLEFDFVCIILFLRHFEWAARFLFFNNFFVREQRIQLSAWRNRQWMRVASKFYIHNTNEKKITLVLNALWASGIQLLPRMIDARTE